MKSRVAWLWLCALAVAWNIPACKRDSPASHERLSSPPTPNLTRPFTETQTPEGKFPFAEIAQDVGLTFLHDTGATGEYYFPEIMGSGCALFDYDNDGDLDVLALQGMALARAGWAGEGEHRRVIHCTDAPTSKLFRNQLQETGRLTFTDVTETSRLVHRGYAMGCAIGDYDNDGDRDVYITQFGPNALYRNLGDGEFEEVSTQAHLDLNSWSTSASFLDYDRDGFLDLYVATYVDFTLQENLRCYTPAGARDYCSPQSYKPLKHRLFRNLGDGTFEDISSRAGLDGAVGSGLGVASADFDGDGWVDIYVANDGEPNFLWRNRGDGTFENQALISGAAVSGTGELQGSMGVAVSDYDGNGKLDIFVTNLKGETNALYCNDGLLSFNDAIFLSGMGARPPVFTGFGVAWLDYDGDGWSDLFVTNGAVTALESAPGDDYPYAQVNRLFHNLGDGTFFETTAESGPLFAERFVGRGVAGGDIDNDGDLDLLISNNRGPLLLLRSNQIEYASTPTPASWVSLVLVGVRCNRDAYGAVVTVESADSEDRAQRSWVRHVQSDGSYLSASDPRILLSFGDEQIRAVRATVRWPGGDVEVWRHLPANQAHVLKQGTQ